MKKIKLLLSFLLIFLNLIGMFNVSFADNEEIPSIADDTTTVSEGTMPTPTETSTSTPTETPSSTPVQTITPTAIPTVTEVPEEGYFNLPGITNVNDVVIHPSKPLLYMTDSTNQKLYCYDINTKELKEISFTLKPERLTFAGGELYVTLFIQHDYCWDESEQEGSIAIIDPDSFTVKETMTINIDPYDVVVDKDGYIYVSGGSDQSTSIKSYSRVSMKEVASSGINMQSPSELNTELNRIYTITTNITPSDYIAYNISNGVFYDQRYLGGYDSPYLGDYALNTNFRISPDSKYLFNGSGVIFICKPDKSEDMRFYFKLKKSFTDIAFDLGKDRFFTYVGGKCIYKYQYSTLMGTGVIGCKGEIQYMFYRDGRLVAISKDNNQLMVELVDVSEETMPTSTPTEMSTSIPTETPSSTPVQTATPTAIPTVTPTHAKIIKPTSLAVFELSCKVNDSALDSQKPVLYFVDKSNNKIVSINYETGEKVELNTFYSPDSIAYSNGELLIGFGQQGMIGTYDAATLNYKDQLLTGETFRDITLGNDGFIYTSCYRNVNSYSRITKQQISSYFALCDTGHIEKNPVHNILYMSKTGDTPPHLYAYRYDNGSILSKYGSQYHGDYAISARSNISPDGKYIFNSSGNIFSSSDDKANDMKFYFRLNKSFNDVAFDIENNKFYTGTNDNSIYAYDYDTLMGTDTYYTKNTVSDLYFRNNRLIAIEKTKDGKYSIELIGEKTEEPTPTPTIQTGFKVFGYVAPDLSYKPDVASKIKDGFKVEIPELGLSTLTDGTGYFEFDNIFSKDGLKLIISKANYLTREISDIKVVKDNGLGSQEAPILLWAGDVVQDQAINMRDIVEMSRYFNSIPGDGKYDSSCDFDLNNAINLVDIIIVANHFNKSSYSSDCDTYEPNNTFSTAKGISGGARITATINDATDVDYYKFDVPSTVRFSLSLTVPSYKDFNVKLYNSSQKEMVNATSGTGSTESIYLTLTKGTYYIEVYGNSGAYSSNPYTLQIFMASDLVPRGNLESPLSEITVSGSIVVGGWFLDGVGVSKIDVLIDEIPVGEALYGTLRKDVYNAFPGYENHYSGYSYTLDTRKLSNGGHIVRIRETGSTGTQTTIGGSYIAVYN